MKVSELYDLGVTQSSLDFVDINVVNDVKVFIDPSAIQYLNSDWGNECVSLIQNFFQEVLNKIRDNKIDDAKNLLFLLHEPNETHLGVSRGKAKGKALGKILATEVLNSLKTSQAVTSGLLEDLEDTILLIEGVGPDIISDITTNIIRKPLIRYTQEACAKYGIDTEEFSSGPIWNPSLKRWETNLVKLPGFEHKKLLFTPKIIVRKRIDYNPGEYYQHYLLERLQEVEISANSALVKLLKDGTKYVTKKSLKEKYGIGKSVVVGLARYYPETLEEYRQAKKENRSEPLSLEELSDSTNSPEPDWDKLLQAVLENQPGTPDAKKYEIAVENLLTAVFYPSLSYPKAQHRLNEGRKIVDIEYTNLLSGEGFFTWFGKHYPAPHVYVECKNYTSDIGNPELDQLGMRFSPSRGKLGILVCRKFDDKDRFIQSCRDTALNQIGYILVLDDSDLQELAELCKNQDSTGIFNFYKSRLNKII